MKIYFYILISFSNIFFDSQVFAVVKKENKNIIKKFKYFMKDIKFCKDTDIHFKECLALIDFYNSTNGDHWGNSWGKYNWKKSKKICTWKGISCDYIDEKKTVTKIFESFHLKIDRN